MKDYSKWGVMSSESANKELVNTVRPETASTGCISITKHL